MNDKVSYRKIRTQPLATVLIRASSAELITDIERLAAVAGVDTATVDPKGEAPPAILTLTEESGTTRSVLASFNELFQPEFAGQQVSVSPRTNPADLLELFVAAGATQRGTVVGVVGGHGGAGATVLAAMLSRQIALDGSASLVDLDPLSAGYDTLLSLPETGKRWADVTKEKSTLLPGRLVASLPEWQDVRVLSGDRRGAVPSGDRTGMSVTTAVSQASAVTVVDLPRHALLKNTSAHETVTWLDHLILVTRSDITDLAQARAILPLIPPTVPTTTVIAGVRSVGQADDAAHQLDVEACPLRFERTFDGDIAHGMTPGDRLRSGSARDIKRIATRILQ